MSQISDFWFQFRRRLAIAPAEVGDLADFGLEGTQRFGAVAACSNRLANC